MEESVIRGHAARLKAELAALEDEADLGAEDRATVTLDQQSVGRLSRMDALQRQAMAAAVAASRRPARPDRGGTGPDS